MSDDTLTDANNIPMKRDDVMDLAYSNILDSMAKADLINIYIDTLDDSALIEWATDAQGLFPND